MSMAVGKRKGGRGCPKCGSHDTESFSRGGSVNWCNSCDHRWKPCKAGCRGYRLDEDSPEPLIFGCPDCGVPDLIARRWPEAWRAMAGRLDDEKQAKLAGMPALDSLPTEPIQ